MIVRDALPGELAEVGDLRVTAYQADGFLSPGSGYAPTLRALGSDGDGIVLVAIDDRQAARDGDDRREGAAGRIVGTVMLQFWPHGGSIDVGPDEAEIRALAVAPGQQGRGTGRALLRAVIGLAARRGVRHLVLLTQPEMLTARHLYEQEGFRRLTERDWAPVPGRVLLAYGLALAAAGAEAWKDGDARQAGAAGAAGPGAEG